jgi:long-chain acyl-CoA synthetase
MSSPLPSAVKKNDPAPDILRDVPPRIHDVITPWAEHSPQSPALVDASGVWTYGDLASIVAETQLWLAASDVRPGDRVMIVCENCRSLAALLLAVTAIDAWPVLVNARLSAREIDAIRDHCGARRVVYTTAVSEHATEHANRHHAVVEDTARLGSVGISPLNGTSEPEPVETDPASRIAALIYTSGTTGLPKGVMLTHKNLLFVAATAAKLRSLTPRDRLYGIMPISHIVGLSVVLVGTLLTGASLYLSQRFDPMTSRAMLEKNELTVMLGVPAMFAQFVQYANLRRLTSLKVPSLRIISCSGAPLHPATKSAAESLFGLVLHHGYGVTELSPNIAQTRIESPRSDISVGPVFPGVEVKLVAPDGDTVPEGQSGELWVRGPNVMRGYYRNPGDTAASLNSEGWFNTRDLARMEDGNLFIVGRTKDLIVHSGFNVYPLEVELVLNAHPAVAQSAVIGKTIRTDEQVWAFVQLLPNSNLTVGELAAYAAQHLVMYKRPSQIFIVASMPMNTNGKIRKSELEKLAEQTQGTNS